MTRAAIRADMDVTGMAIINSIPDVVRPTLHGTTLSSSQNPYQSSSELKILKTNLQDKLHPESDEESKGIIKDGITAIDDYLRLLNKSNLRIQDGGGRKKNKTKKKRNKSKKKSKKRRKSKSKKLRKSKYK